MKKVILISFFSILIHHFSKAQIDDNCATHPQNNIEILKSFTEFIESYKSNNAPGLMKHFLFPIKDSDFSTLCDVNPQFFQNNRDSLFYKMPSNYQRNYFTKYYKSILNSPFSFITNTHINELKQSNESTIIISKMKSINIRLSGDDLNINVHYNYEEDGSAQFNWHFKFVGGYLIFDHLSYID